MALVNRDKDASEQRDVLTYTSPAVVGVSLLVNLGIAPCAQQMIAIQVAAFGLSSTPILNFQINRFITGLGNTTIIGGFTSLSIAAAFGTSGPAATLVPLTAGSTLVQLLRGDLVQVVTSGANSAANYVISAVVQTLQDVKTNYGV